MDLSQENRREGIGVSEDDIVRELDGMWGQVRDYNTYVYGDDLIGNEEFMGSGYPE